MRFSYIDSQGKEIEVDSVESLALRIELGAITADTRMYDAVADRWAPADEHPVYRSLARGEELTEADVVHIGQEEPPPAAPDAEAAGEEEVREEGDDGADAEDADGEGGGSGDELGLDFSVTLSDDEPQAAPPEEDAPSGDGARVEEMEEWDPDRAAGEPEAAPGKGGGEDESGGEVDADGVFGDLGALELEEEPAGKESGDAEAGDGLEAWDAEVEAPVDPEAPVDDPAEPEDEEPAGAEELPSWAAEGESLWDDEGAGGVEDIAWSGPSGGVEEEDRPLPPPEPDERLPEWASREEEAGDEAPEAIREEPCRQKAAAPRPAHWEERARAQERNRRLLRGGGAAVLVLALGLAGALALGVGPFERDEETTEGPVRPVLLPGLRATATEMAEAAYADVLDGFAGEWEARGLPERPPGAWLEGIYLSTAGDYPGVRTYWEAVAAAVEDLRERESERFGALLAERLDQRTAPAGSDGAGEGTDRLAPSEADRVREAVLFDFRATAPERAGEYGSILSVADASLDLHALLVERQQDIAYEPYSDPGVSRDPVLEAVPSDSTLRAEMNARIDRVLETVAESGIPRPITTEALGTHLLEELREVGVVLPEPPPGAEAGGSE